MFRDLFLSSLHLRFMLSRRLCSRVASSEPSRDLRIFCPFSSRLWKMSVWASISACSSYGRNRKQYIWFLLKNPGNYDFSKEWKNPQCNTEQRFWLLLLQQYHVLYTKPCFPFTWRPFALNMTSFPHRAHWTKFRKLKV